MPSTSRFLCYFGCKIDGPLHRFPKPNFKNSEKFSLWKAVLNPVDQVKDDNYIYNQFKICNRHFSECYRLPSNRLSSNAIPRLNFDKDSLECTSDQDEDPLTEDEDPLTQDEDPLAQDDDMSGLPATNSNNSTNSPADTQTALDDVELVLVPSEDNTSCNGFDSETLQILADNPLAVEQFSKDKDKRLANRLEHTATTGLSKETRKELNKRYLVPASTAKISAPLLNPEIEAAVTDVAIKRDKKIEARQRQLAAAISGLAEIVSREMESKDKDITRLKQLTDVCHILCDIQHADSVTRRNLVMCSIKDDLKEHLINTNIDKYLFGENLADALNTAKEATKSGSELKVKALPPKPRPSTSSAAALNWKIPAPVRRQQGAQRYRERTPSPPPFPKMQLNLNWKSPASARRQQSMQQYRERTPSPPPFPKLRFTYTRQPARAASSKPS